MHNVQYGVFGFMTPTVKTVRMSPAISALAAVNSRFPQSAERTINELWAHRRGRAAQPQSRASAIAKDVAVTVERARRRDGAADHQSSRVLMRSAPTQYCSISSKGRASALSRSNCTSRLRETSRPRRPVVLDQTCFLSLSAFGHAFQTLEDRLGCLPCGNVGVGSSSSIISAPAVCAEDLHDLTAACSDCLPAHS